MYLIIRDNPTCPKMDEIEISRHGVHILLSELDERKAFVTDNKPAIALNFFADICPLFVNCVHA